MLTAVAVLHYETVSIKFCKQKKETRNEGFKGLKVWCTFVRVAQNLRYLISFYYFHLFFFFTISSFVLISRNTSIFVASVIGPKTVVQALSKEWYEKRAGTGGREHIFCPAILFLRSRASYFSSDSIIFGTSLISEILVSIRLGLGSTLMVWNKPKISSLFGFGKIQLFVDFLMN